MGEIHTATVQFFLNLIVDTTLKSVNIWRSYRQNYVGSFLWLTVYNSSRYEIETDEKLQW